MKIAHIIAGVPVESGGPTHVLREMTARLARLGHEITVVTTDSDGAGGRLSDAGFAPEVEVELWPAQLRRSPHGSLRHALAMTQLRCDVAHVHGLFAVPVTFAMVALRLRKIPYVLRPCGMLDVYSLEQRRTLKRAWLALADRANIAGAAVVQASTEHEADAVLRLVPTANVRVLPQGVDAPPAPSGRRLHARPYLLFLSRIAPKKGLARLVDAFAALAPNNDLDLVVVGPDEHGHRAAIEAQVAALGLGARVRFVGAARGIDKSDWFAGAEAFVLPSLDENFGVVVIEAAHLGVPIVVSDQVGLAPAVHAHHAGLVVTHDERLDQAILQVLHARSSFRAGCQSLARAFAWEPLARELVAIYRDIAR